MNLSRPRLFVIAALAWAAALAVAAAVDAPTADWVIHHPQTDNALVALHIVSVMGNFFFTLGLAAAVLALTRGNWRAALLPCLAGIVGGAIYQVLKWCVGRPRPHAGVHPFDLHPFPMGAPGLWEANNLSFPSGHTCLAFATAGALAMSFPRGRFLFLAVAAMVGVERVLEGAHYPSDVVGGMAVGLFSAWVAAKWWPPAPSGRNAAPALRTQQSSP